MNQTGKQVRVFPPSLVTRLIRRGTPHYDKTFFDLLRRRMAQDRERARNASPNQWPASGMTSNYFVPFSIISFLVGFGILIHTLKGR